MARDLTVGALGRKRVLALLTAIGLAASAAVAAALNFGAGPSPVTYEPGAPFALPEGGVIVVEGVVSGAAPAALALRVDDRSAPVYADRFNLTKNLGPGPFRVELPVAQLKTQAGRPLEIDRITRMMAFEWPETGRVSVSRFEAAPARAPQTAEAGATDAVPAAADFGAGAPPIAHEPGRPFALPADGVIRLEGVVAGDEPTTLALRADDAPAPGYADRFNLTRSAAPGAFKFEIPVASLKTASGRALQTDRLTRIIAFEWPETGRVAITRFDVGAAARASGPAAPEQASAEAVALRLGAGAPPLAHEPGRPFAAPEGGAIVIEGRVSGAEPATLALRVDDAPAPAYADRFNAEKTLAPGAFSFRTPVAALKTPSGRPLTIEALTRIIAFEWPETGRVAIDRFELVGPPAPAVDDAADDASGEAAGEASGEVAGAATISAEETFDLGAGRGSVAYEPWSSFDLSGWDEVVIEGEAITDDRVHLVFRIDDAASTGYSDRFNLSVIRRAGPFSLRVPLRGAKAPNGRIMDLTALKRVLIAAYEGGDVAISRFAAVKAAGLPNGARGYALGPADAPAPAGMTALAPGDPAVIGPRVRAVRRPAPDPLLATGLQGVRHLRLPAPPGRARVTVWTEDPGEWSVLPHPLRRIVRVNGRAALDRAETAQEWIARRYLAGRWREHGPEDDAWTAFGRHRGEAVSIDVDVGAEGVVIEFEGGTPAATHVAAAAVQPLGDGADPDAAARFVEEKRAEWYRTRWLVKDAPPDRAAPDAVLERAQGETALRGADGAPLSAMRAVAAPGTGVRLTLSVSSDQAAAAPALRFDPPTGPGGAALSGRVWAGFWKLQRRALTPLELHLADDMLVSDVAKAPLRADAPRRYEMWIAAPEDAAPGVYRGALTLEIAGRAVETPIEIEVLGVALPAAPKPAGFYSAYPHHLDYFPRLTLDRDRQAACDLAFFAELGLRGTAAPIKRPDPTNLSILVNDVRRAQRYDVAPGWLAYNPLTAPLAQNGPDAAARLTAVSEAALRAAGLPSPYWSVADEPSNPGQGEAALDVWIEALRRHAPQARLAGHLNAPGDERYAALFDAILINYGFGLDADRVERFAREGRAVWFYNTFHPRLTAGLWLWRTPAERYVQWHARMPTADPFDPFDGREGDFQALYPSPEICPETPDAHRDLLRMAEGVVDQRWLVWLDGRGEPDAAALRARIMARIGGRWSVATQLDDRKMDEIRSDIIALARKLQ